jgi:cytochrome P450
MGVPEDDWPRLTRLTTMAIAPDDPDFSEGGPASLALVAAHHELFQYFSRQVAARAGRLSSDLIGVLMDLEIDGAPLTHESIIYNCYSLILGANVTTPHTITAAVQILIEQPDVHRRVRADRRLVRSFLEEALRWSSPANHFMRYAKRDVQLGGHDVPSGAAVVVWLGSANRDEDVFAHPYVFDVQRHPNPHIAFGYGPHFCIGAALARTSLELLFNEILARVERFELTGIVAHLASNFVAGIKRFPVRAVPVARTSTTPEAGE